MQQANTYTCHRSRIRHPVQVNKTRITHHPIVRVKHEKRHYIQYQGDKQPHRHLSKTTDKVSPAMLQIEHKQPR